MRKKPDAGLARRQNGGKDPMLPQKLFVKSEKN
jgi:hypothetical protein